MDLLFDRTVQQCPSRCPAPTKRSDASSHPLVQRIPADIEDRVRGSTVAVRVGEEIVIVRVLEKAQDIRPGAWNDRRRTRNPAMKAARRYSDAGRSDDGLASGVGAEPQKR